MCLPPTVKSAGKVLRPALVIGLGKTTDIATVPASGALPLMVPASSLVIYQGMAVAE